MITQLCLVLLAIFLYRRCCPGPAMSLEFLGLCFTFGMSLRSFVKTIRLFAFSFDIN